MGPLEPRVAAEARRLGLETASAAPAGAVEESAAFPSERAGGQEHVADWTRLRFLLWRAAASGASGVWFRLPGGDLLAYPEEWQAVARAARELRAVRPVIDGGADAPAPFAPPAGVLARSWTSAGRRYVLLVNVSGAPAPLAAELLEPWRALFSVRADARQVLPVCGTARCLPPEGALWLEGRLGSGWRP